MKTVLRALREQKRSSLLFVIILCMGTMIWQWSVAIHNHPFLSAQYQFMEREGENWTEEAENEWMRAFSNNELLYAEEYTTKEGFNQIVKKERELAIYTDSLNNDMLMLSELKNSGKAYELTVAYVENNQKLYARNMERYGSHPYDARLFGKMYESFASIQFDNMIYVLPATNDFFEVWRSDVLFILIGFIISFHYFANMKELGEGRLLLTSPKSLKKYVLVQYIVGLIFSVAATLLYELFRVALWWKFALADVWNAPVQCIESCRQIGFAMSVWQYILAIIGMNLLVTLVISAIVQLVSMFSSNSFFAFFGGLVATGGVFVVFSGITLGNENGLKLRHAGLRWCDEIPYMRVGNYPVPYWMVLLVLSLIIVEIVACVIVCSARRMIVRADVKGNINIAKRTKQGKNACGNPFARSVFFKHGVEFGGIILAFCLIVLYPNCIAPMIRDMDGGTRTRAVRQTDARIEKESNELMDEWCAQTEDYDIMQLEEFLNSQLLENEQIQYENGSTVNSRIYSETVGLYQQVLDKIKVCDHLQQLYRGEINEILMIERQQKAIPYDRMIEEADPLRMMNPAPLSRFLSCQDYCFLFVIGIILALILWGDYFSVRMDRIEWTSCFGTRGMWQRHGIAIGLIVLFGVVYILFSLKSAGLLAQMKNWDCSIWVASEYFTSMSTLTIGGVIVIFFLLQVVNCIFWYMMTFLLLAKIRRSIPTCFVVSSILFLIYVIRNILMNYQCGSVVLTGYFSVAQMLKSDYWFTPYFFRYHGGDNAYGRYAPYRGYYGS